MLHREFGENPSHDRTANITATWRIDLEGRPVSFHFLIALPADATQRASHFFAWNVYNLR